jgi:hypothetical protein
MDTGERVRCPVPLPRGWGTGVQDRPAQEIVSGDFGLREPSPCASAGDGDRRESIGPYTTNRHAKVNAVTWWTRGSTLRLRVTVCGTSKTPLTGLQVRGPIITISPNSSRLDIRKEPSP